MSETDITESVNSRNDWSVAQVSSLSILQELKTLTDLWVMSWIGTQCLLLRLYLSDFSTVVTSVKQHCLRRALQLHGTGSDSIDRLLLSLIFHCAKDDDHTRGIKTLEAAFTCVSPSCKTLFLYYNFDTTQPYLKPMWNLGVYLQQRVLQYVLWSAWLRIWFCSLMVTVDLATWWPSLSGEKMDRGRRLVPYGYPSTVQGEIIHDLF